MEINEIVKKKLKPLIILGILMGIVFGSIIWTHSTIRYSVEMSLNPSVKVDVNILEKVIAFEGLNEEGIELVKELNLKGSNILDAAESITKEISLMGYTENAEIISIEISGRSLEKAEDLEVRLTNTLIEFMEAEKINLKSSFSSNGNL